MAKDPERYLSNPLNSYLLIKRLTADVDSIFDSVGSLAEGNVGVIRMYTTHQWGYDLEFKVVL
jgi:hypothetical protein